MVRLGGRQGAILLEAMVALSILTLVGGAAVAVIAMALRNQQRIIAWDQVQEEADRLLTAMSLLKRRDLDLRIGERTVGSFVTEVTRPERALYRISIAAKDRPDVELLATVVFRVPEFSR